MASRITRRADTMGGAYCIRGTRIPVRTVKECAAYWDLPKLLREYPSLTEDDVKAALAFHPRTAGGVR